MKVFPLLLCGLLVLSCAVSSKSARCSVAPCPGAKADPASLGKPAKDRPDGVEGRGDIFSDYVIGAEDVVEVSVWKNEPLSKVVTVRPDGKISLPLIGDVQAAGLTASELKKAIMEKLLEYKETPTVSVIVQQVNSYAVYITGEVLHPGKYPVKSPVTLLQGITLAGGFTPYASKNNILLLRGSRSGGIRIKVKYKDILSGRKGSVDPILLPGDTVVIP